MSFISHIGEELKKMRKSRKLTLQKVADITGTFYPQIWRYEKGKSTPREETLEKILIDAFKMPQEEAKEKIAEWKIVYEREKLSKIKDKEIFGSTSNQFAPVYKSIEDFLDKNLSEENWIIPQKALEKYPKNTCAYIRIHEDSMAPTIDKNDYVLISTEEKPIISEKFYLITYEGKPLIRKIKENSRQIELLAENKNCSPIILTNEQRKKLSIVGKIILVEKLID